MGRSIRILLGGFLVLLGLLCAMWPVFEGNAREEQYTETAESFPQLVSEENGDEAELWEAMRDYNLRLLREQPEGPQTETQCEETAQLESGEALDGVLATIEIPTADIFLPVYSGASKEHLNQGAAVLGRTSLPVGGAGTNCVIAGHRGYRGAAYFRYLPEVAIGDEVYVTNGKERLVYTVTEKKIIAPSDTGDLRIRSGEDRLTLLTCHPYASGGKQRYVVLCVRKSTGEGEMNEKIYESGNVLSGTAPSGL